MAVSAVYVVNLRGDSGRWEIVQCVFSPFDFIRLQRIEAVYGSSLPHDVCVRLTHDPYAVVAKGALGCALSHVRAWEIIGGGEDPWALVIEDDASMLGIERLAILDLPDGLDFAFCNHRTQPEVPPAPSSADGAPVHIALKACLTAIGSRRRAVGTDGYVVSRTGAQRLVALYKQHGYFSHVDLRMLAYAVDADELQAQLPEDSWLRRGIL